MSADKILKTFLLQNKILIADKNNVSRSRLKKSMVDLGASPDNVFTTADYNEALDYAKEHNPQIVLSDYLILHGSGFDLFKEYKAHFPHLKKIITILITSNTDQSTVARAAEEDVDSFLIKPYSAKGLIACLSQAVNLKLNPSKYMKTIDLGKEELFRRNYQQAKLIFEKAVSLSSEPSLALFYKGQAEYLLQMTNEAEDDYKKGLDVNKIHFKCQVGLYEILRDQKRHDEAYAVVRNLAKYFPANPKRLAEVVRLCITTKNYQDMLEYHTTFTTLTNRTEELRKYVASGMYIAGKYQYLNNYLDSGFVYFEKVAISFYDNIKVLNEIVNLLLDKKQYERADKILARYPLGKKDGQFDLLSYLAKAPSYLAFERIHKGELLISKNIIHYDVFKYLLLAYQEKNDNVSFEKYLTKAKDHFPEIDKEFSKAA